MPKLYPILFFCLLANTNFAQEEPPLEHGLEHHRHSEQLFDQAQETIEKSRKLRQKIAKEKPSQNYREISSKESVLQQWQQEMDQILAD